MNLDKNMLNPMGMINGIQIFVINREKAPKKLILSLRNFLQTPTRIEPVLCNELDCEGTFIAIPQKLVLAILRSPQVYEILYKDWRSAIASGKLYITELGEETEDYFVVPNIEYHNPNVAAHMRSMLQGHIQEGARMQL